MNHAPSLSSILKVKHAFFTREGGISQGVYASLNCGIGSLDKPESIAENRARAAIQLGAKPEHLCTLKQVHGKDVVIIENPLGDLRPEADAMVTKVPGLMLGILTADCAPVLLVDPINQVIGAAHAGWRGALAGVARATVRAMIELGAQSENIIAVIGPCIAQRSYDVDLDFSKAFLEVDPTYGVYFTPSETPKKIGFSLRGFMQHELRESGVSHIEALDDDTFADEKRFFSYRRETQRGLAKEGDYGRQLSAIMLV